MADRGIALLTDLALRDPDRAAGGRSWCAPATAPTSSCRMYEAEYRDVLARA